MNGLEIDESSGNSIEWSLQDLHGPLTLILLRNFLFLVKIDVINRPGILQDFDRRLMKEGLSPLVCNEYCVILERILRRLPLPYERFNHIYPDQYIPSFVPVVNSSSQTKNFNQKLLLL